MSSLQQWITDNIPANYLPLLILIIVGVLMAISLFFFIWFMVCRSKYNKLIDNLRDCNENFKSEYLTTYNIFGIKAAKCVINLIDVEDRLNGEARGRIKELLDSLNTKEKPANIEKRIKELVKKEGAPVVQFISQVNILMSKMEELLNSPTPLPASLAVNVLNMEKQRQKMERLLAEDKPALSSVDTEDTKRNEPEVENKKD